jgi:hypothetical protein
MAVCTCGGRASCICTCICICIPFVHMHTANTDDDDVCFTVMGVRRAEYVVWNEASRARDGGARPHRMSDD